MPANINPIFSRTPQVEWITGVTVANTTKDLTAGTSYLVFTADATEGSMLQRVVIMPLGTNIATVVRAFINNGSVTTTAANNAMVGQQSIPATTNTEVAALTPYEIPLNIAMPPGYRLYVTTATVVAAGFTVTGFGGKL